MKAHPHPAQENISLHSSNFPPVLVLMRSCKSSQLLVGELKSDAAIPAYSRGCTVTCITIAAAIASVTIVVLLVVLV